MPNCFSTNIILCPRESQRTDKIYLESVAVLSSISTEISLALVWSKRSKKNLTLLKLLQRFIKLGGKVNWCFVWNLAFSLLFLPIELESTIFSAKRLLALYSLFNGLVNVRWIENYLSMRKHESNRLTRWSGFLIHRLTSSDWNDSSYWLMLIYAGKVEWRSSIGGSPGYPIWSLTGSQFHSSMRFAEFR